MKQKLSPKESAKWHSTGVYLSCMGFRDSLLNFKTDLVELEQIINNTKTNPTYDLIILGDFNSDMHYLC